MRTPLLLAVLALVLFPSASASAQEPETAPVLRFGAAVEGARAEVDFRVDDLDAADWQGVPIPGEGSDDPNDNADYGALRAHACVLGFVEFRAARSLTLAGFVRVGQVREILRASHGEGSTFVDWGDRTENEAAAFVGAVLFGAGAAARFALDDLTVGLEASFARDQSSTRNQRLFTQRVDGTVTFLTYELRLSAAYRLGFFTPRASLGLLMYSVTGDFTQTVFNNTRVDRYHVVFSAATPLLLTLGADLDEGKILFARAELRLIAEFGFAVCVGARI